MTQTARPAEPGGATYPIENEECAMLLYDNLSVTPQGHLAVGGVDTVDLARQFGAPLYVVDEDQLRANCRTYVQALAEHLKQGCAAKDYPVPRILLEPGRSIVADAALTLYEVGGVKTIEGYRSYVTVNGGMTDNPRYALYRSPYTVLPASRMGEEGDFLCSLAGRCCESGDLVQENITLPQPRRGDLLAVLTTGAYNFSMASNYNRLCRPAVVMVREGASRLIVRRETMEDLIRCDL